jgi:hypothetical protein
MAFTVFVKRIQCSSPCPRREIERELREHFEDMAAEARSQGYDEAFIGRKAAIRFGDLRQVVAAFTSVYALVRWMPRARPSGTPGCGANR